MSHAIGAVKFEDNSILYYEYNGTCDIVLPKLRQTREEVWDNWRKWEDAPCLHPDNCQAEPVEIMSTYGGSFYWNGRACKKCMAITSGLNVVELGEGEERDGRPIWCPFEAEEFC